MITKLKIRGYKSIKDQEISLNAVNILIGGNGVGKSNFISVFSLIRAIYEGKLAAYVIQKGGADSILHFGKKTTREASFDFHLGENRSTNRFLISLANAQDALFIKSIDTAYFKDTWHFQEYERNVRESDFKNITWGQAFWVNDRLKEFEVYHFHDTGDDSPMKGHSHIDDNRYLRKNGSNIAAFLFYLKQNHPRNFLRIEKTVNAVAPFFEKFVLEPSRNNGNLIKLEWQEKGSSDSYFDAYTLSDGTLRFICLATLLMQPDPPKTIIIDEPELGLHPVAINKLAGLVRKISEKSQLIISTQSLNLVDNFEPEDIIVADRIENQTVFKRRDEEGLEEWIEEYSLGDIWGKNIFGGQPI